MLGLCNTNCLRVTIIYKDKQSPETKDHISEQLCVATKYTSGEGQFALKY